MSVSVKIEKARTGDQPPLNTGTIGWARVNNALHRVDTPFSERSAGFVWFFSFLVKFSRVKSEEESVVILLDEPGLTLHGRAQGELLRFFNEKLAPYHQLIFSTHSPFMVPGSELSKVRIVEDRVEIRQGRRTPIGTQVRSDVLSTDPDTIFPLQGALGYEITQSLFVGENTLLVEGPSDILFLQSLSARLKALNRPGLDPRWILCPSGGIDKIRPFASLFGANAMNVAVLSDQSKSDQKKIDSLRASQILATEKVLAIGDLLGREEADIEDIFDPQLYSDILNATYALTGDKKVTPEKLKNTVPITSRIVKQAEQLFRLMPSDVPGFDHFAPSSYLIRTPAILEGSTKKISETLDRAQIVFDRVNSLL